MNLKGKRICITGIGGFIGSRFAELAREKGMLVQGLELDQQRAEILRSRGFTVTQGSIEDQAAIEQSMQDCQFVLHLAAVMEEGGDLEFFRRINVSATLKLAETARKHGVKGFVQLSSVMVYGFDYPVNVTEDGPKRGEGNPYCITKIEGEAALRDMPADNNFGVIIIRPGDVYGPGSVPWLLRPLELMRKGIFALPDKGQGLINHTYVDNLVQGILLALEKEAYGQTFNITDGNCLTWMDFFTRVAALENMGPPRRLPAWLIKTSLHIVCFFYRLLGKKPPALPEGVNYVRRKQAVSISRAREVLGYEPQIDLEEGFARITRSLAE